MPLGGWSLGDTNRLYLLSSINVLLKAASITCVLFIHHSRIWKEGYQIEQWPTTIIPVLYELPRGQSL